MNLLHLLFSLLFMSGFYYLGNIIINLFNLENVVKKISEQSYQNISIGLVSFLFILYPIFFLGLFTYNFFSITSYSILILGALNVLINLIFIPILGLKGAVLASIVSNVVSTFLILFIKDNHNHMSLILSPFDLKSIHRFIKY